MTTISEMLSRNSRTYPDDIALIERVPCQGCQGKRTEITWHDFDERVNRIAHAMQQRGIKKGDRVMHLMRNSINWLEAYFGIIRTGAWVVPLNYRFTAQEIAYCADISMPKLMIVDGEFVGRIEDAGSQLRSVKERIAVGSYSHVGYDLFEKVIAGSSPDVTQVPIDDSDECGLYFTSGTTGRPKPILLTHRNMESAAITEWSHHQQRKQDNFILIPPLYHSGAKMHWYGSLIVGGRATILREVNPKNIFDAVHSEQGTIVWLLVPWAYDILQALDDRELKKDDYDLSHWRLMHIGAQPVPVSLVRRWKAYFPDMQFDNNYGLSEASGPGCVHLGIENEHKEGSIGKAGFNWEVRIVEENGIDVVEGKVGEVIVKGNGVMKEYYGNPELTSQTIKNGWLYTGDMARVDEEGFVYLVDRKKDTIISGGENIYPVEIEDVLHMHSKVFDVGVIGVHDERLGEVIAAVIDLKPGESITEQEILEYCNAQLPRYKRPRFIFFDSVPRSPTGKIEKIKLRDKYAENFT